MEYLKLFSLEKWPGNLSTYNCCTQFDNHSGRLRLHVDYRSNSGGVEELLWLKY